MQPVVQPKTPDTIKICSKCRSEIGRGKPHHCTAAEAVKNLTKAAVDLSVSFGASGEKSYQRVSSNLLKVAAAEQNVPRGEAMKLATSREVGKFNG